MPRPAVTENLPGLGDTGERGKRSRTASIRDRPPPPKWYGRNLVVKRFEDGADAEGRRECGAMPDDDSRIVNASSSSSPKVTIVSTMPRRGQGRDLRCPGSHLN